jgi:hypothetical protein
MKRYRDLRELERENARLRGGLEKIANSEQGAASDKEAVWLMREIARLAIYSADMSSNAQGDSHPPDENLIQRTSPVTYPRPEKRNPPPKTCPPGIRSNGLFADLL